MGDEAEVGEGGGAPGGGDGAVGDEHAIHDKHLVVRRLRPHWGIEEEEAIHLRCRGGLGVGAVVVVAGLSFVEPEVQPPGRQQ